MLCLLLAACLGLCFSASAEEAFADLLASGDLSAWWWDESRSDKGGWKLENGVVHRHGERPGSLITREKYTDFEFVFQWKIAEAGNSGVIYRNKKGKGLEYQLLDDERHYRGQFPISRAAALYDLAPRSDDACYKPAGKWNTGRILVQGTRIQHWLNGVLVVDIDQSSPLWQERLEASKFKEDPNHGTYASGIQLQDHGAEVWFRELKIRPLDR